jgi:hypothetical protein
VFIVHVDFCSSFVKISMWSKYAIVWYWIAKIPHNKSFEVDKNFSYTNHDSQLHNCIRPCLPIFFLSKMTQIIIYLDTCLSNNQLILEFSIQQIKYSWRFNIFLDNTLFKDFWLYISKILKIIWLGSV